MQNGAERQKNKYTRALTLSVSNSNNLVAYVLANTTN